jgi:hypothetical protein
MQAELTRNLRPIFKFLASPPMPADLLLLWKHCGNNFGNNFNFDRDQVNNSSISNLDFRAAVQEAREALKDAADLVVRAVVAAHKAAAVGAEEIVVGAEIAEVQTVVSHSDEAAEASMQPRPAATFPTRLRIPAWMPRHIP